jgi:hypothetical protein
MICITQLLCPQRHCVLAAVWDDCESSAQQSEEKLRDGFRKAVHTGALNPFCGLCRSEVLHCESGVTQWSTMEEAMPHLRKEEREQILVAAAVASHRD